MSVIDSSKLEFYIPRNVGGLELFTCNDITCSFSPHFNDAYCIWLNTISAEKYNYNGSSHYIYPGELSIIAPPGDVHSNSVMDVSSRYLINFYLDHDQLQELSQQIDEKTAEVTFTTAEYKSESVVHSLLRLHDVVRYSASTLETQTVFIETFAKLLFNFGTKKMSEKSLTGEQRRIRKIIDILNSYYADDISLNDLAHEVNCTPFHLIRFFLKRMWGGCHLMHISCSSD